MTKNSYSPNTTVTFELYKFTRLECNAPPFSCTRFDDIIPICFLSHIFIVMKVIIFFFSKRSDFDERLVLNLNQCKRFGIRLFDCCLLNRYFIYVFFFYLVEYVHD